MSGLAYTGIGVCALLCACGGKAVIDADSGSGAGGSTSNTMTTGGTGGVPSTGGGGTGGDEQCTYRGLIEVAGDGPLQTYEAAGPDPTQVYPTGHLFYGPGGATLELIGCLSNSSTNNCIRLSAEYDEFSQTTSTTRIEYTSANGIVFVGDSGFMDLYDITDDDVLGYYEGDVLASGGADQRYVFGDFSVCRSPDVGTR
jgi:hypothetical protein